jgi:hypothetical protein
MKRVALILAALLVAGCEAPPPPDPRPSALLAELAARWPAEAHLPRLADAVAHCDRKDWEGCAEIRNRQDQVSVSVSACREDASSMCVALRERVSLLADRAKYFPAAHQVLLPDTPFYWRLPNRFLDQLSDEHSYRIEVAKTWYGRVYWYVALALLCAMILPLILERIWRWLLQFNAIKNLVRRLRGEKPVKVLKFAGRRARSAATCEQAAVTYSNTSSRADTNQLDRPLQPEDQRAAHVESEAAQTSYTPEMEPEIAPGSDTALNVADSNLTHSTDVEKLAQTAPPDEKTVRAPVRKNYDEDPDLKALTALFSGRPK